MSAVNDVATRLAHVRERIAAAERRSGRGAGAVRLIAVSKGVPAGRVQEAITCGVTDIGENRVAEAETKRSQVEHPVRWHLIGHLQTNKARRAAALFDAVHSVDSDRVARALAAHRPPDAEPLAVLVEVDFTGIAGRTGVREAQVEPLMRTLNGLPGVHLLGLMTIAAAVEAPEQARPFFARLRRLRDHLQAVTGWPLPELSMGMSGDFDVAIEEGATMVRVGSAIFGARA